MAETSASVVVGRFGMDAAASPFPSIARWAQDEALLKRNPAEVQGRG